MNKTPMSFAQKQKTITLNEQSWKILIVDDEPEVHTLTKTVLDELVYDGRKIEFLDAYSGKEAMTIVSECHNIALILLDVVMETDSAGLDVVKYIRENLKNSIVQIILRTGQPGSAPEDFVIREYEINDYKEKTELTSKKLTTSVLTALRAYKNLMALERNRSGLEMIVNSTKTLFQNRSEKQFLEGVLTQMEAFLHLDDEALAVQYSGFTASKNNDSGYTVIVGTGQFRSVDKIDEKVLRYLERATQARQSFFDDDVYIGYFETQVGKSHLIYFQGCAQLSKTSKDLVEVFSSKVAVALENFELNFEIMETKREIINTLGNVVESRSKETAQHVQRIAEFCYFLAIKYGLSEEEALLIKQASPLHDIGKVGISDGILLKPSRLDNDEMSIMKTHASIGYEILRPSKRDIIKAAAIISFEHHEKYDGTGYPSGLAGEEIHIYGRITAIADVFDALYHDRCYKKAWSIEEIVEYFKAQRGKQFDPKLTDIFLDNIDGLVSLNKQITEAA